MVRDDHGFLSYPSNNRNRLEPARLYPYEIATGVVPVGADPRAAALGMSAPGMSARQALERSVLAALTGAPCTVSFSGGRDSSAVLAVCVHVARREGLPLPVPLTLRTIGRESDEAAWQEFVIRHLRVRDWERIWVDDIDLVGPLAARGLRRHGLLWPPNAHFHVPMFERAKGGALLTGVDGDVLLGGWRWARPSVTNNLPATAGLIARYAPQLTSHVKLVGRNTAHVAFSSLPSRARAMAAPVAMTAPAWIRPDAWPRVAAFLASYWELEPRHWARRVSWWSRRRYLACGRRSLSLLADDHRVHIIHPLLDRSFLAALAREGGARGFGGRTAAMRFLVGDLLPDSVLTRGTKAFFDSAIWSSASRSFIANWSGDGVDTSLVDVDRLRQEWEKESPNFATATLLQAVWLNSTVGGDE